MNMTGKRNVFGGLLCGLIVLAGMWLICGRLVMVEGLGKFILWLIPMAAVVTLKDRKLISAGAGAVLIVLYLVIGIAMSSAAARPIRSGHIGKDHCAVYELNPGAMGHTSYRLIRYNDVVSCKIFGVNMLTVRILNSARIYRSLDGLPSFSGE